MSENGVAPDYRYWARVIRVIDGDTLELEIDMGLRIHRIERVRLLGVDCPEMNQSGGAAAMQFTHEWSVEYDLNPRMDRGKNWPLVIETHKSDSFGRWLARVYSGDMTSCLNDDLVKCGLAEKKGS